MTESSIFSDLERIKTNMIKHQKRNEDLEKENAKLKSAVAWQKETIAARDAEINRLMSSINTIVYECAYGKGYEWLIECIDNEREGLGIEVPNRTEAEIEEKEEING